MNLSNWGKGYIGIYHYLWCLKYLTIIIKKKKVLILCLKCLTIMIKNKTGLSKVLATEESSKSAGQVRKGSAKPVQRPRRGPEVLPQELRPSWSWGKGAGATAQELSDTEGQLQAWGPAPQVYQGEQWRPSSSPEPLITRDCAAKQLNSPLCCQ